MSWSSEVDRVTRAAQAQVRQMSKKQLASKATLIQLRARRDQWASELREASKESAGDLARVGSAAFSLGLAEAMIKHNHPKG